MKININEILDMNQYTEKGKKDLEIAAGAIGKMFSFLSEEELEVLQDLIATGNDTEIYQLMGACFLEKQWEERRNKRKNKSNF